MNTLAFTLGVLSVIITAFVVVLVWGVVKVVKQQKQIRNINEDFSRSISDVYRIISDNDNRVYRDIDERTRETLSTNKSYTDMRIDKFIEKTGKKLIKG